MLYLTDVKAERQFVGASLGCGQLSVGGEEASYEEACRERWDGSHSDLVYVWWRSVRWAGGH